jgi:hypothetical protein
MMFAPASFSQLDRTPQSINAPQEQLLGHNAGQAAQQVAPPVDDDRLLERHLPLQPATSNRVSSPKRNIE